MRKAIITAILSIIVLCPTIRSQSIDYTIPYPRPLHDAADTLTLFFIGDVMMHAPQFDRDHRVFFKNIATPMREADFTIANMELTLGGQPYSGYPAFSAPEYIAPYMADDCGTDVFLMANNHIFDKGAKGLQRTLDIYDELGEEYGLKWTGVARSQEELEATTPLMLFKKGFKIAIINCTYGTNNDPHHGFPNVNYLDEEALHSAFERAKDQGADFILALPHWGLEYQLKHSKTQEKWANFFVKEGADAIIGSHPHVVQDTTHIKGVPVIYSLGNAVSNMSATNTRLELAVTVRFVQDRTKGTKKMLEPELSFMWCTIHDTLTPSYATIFVKEWANRRNDWLTPYDFDNMLETYRRVKTATGIED